jgi:exodeoxyribonuclease VII small subunit
MSQTFEKSLEELEFIVKKLEEGEMPLEESLEIFERGVKLARECKEKLVAAERRIEVLSKSADGSFEVSELS